MDVQLYLQSKTLLSPIPFNKNNNELVNKKTKRL